MISASRLRLADAGPMLKLLFFSTLFLSSANAQTFTVLHAFTGNPDGASSYASLLLAGGVLYGTTEQGGDQTCNCGTVFKIDTNGAETVLHSFAGWPSDGGYPVAGLLISHSGELYGTASEGGSGNAGAVFRMDTNGVENLIYSFNGDGSGGVSPDSGLVQDTARNIYGTTYTGGLYGAGNIYEISEGRKEAPIYSFRGGADGGDPAYGSLILDAAGNLYGTATQGGTKTDGVVFGVNSAGAFTVLRNFGPSGLGAYSGLVADSIGNLYGVTTYGGIRNCSLGCGTVFKVGLDGSARGIYHFTGGRTAQTQLRHF